MKACVIQPPYSTDYSLSDQMFQWEMDSLDQCDESMDLIVLPEASDVPCLTSSREEFIASSERYKEPLLKKAAETARRCQAVVFINANYTTEKGLRNTTYAFDKEGHLAGKYFKQHLTPGEVTKRKLDSDYSFEFEEPTVITIDGIQYGFLICYDFYFYEMFANMARQNLDIIIGCSHQRSDKVEAIELISRFCAYNCNAYVVRSSVSMDENSDIGGGSLVVAPDGEVLVNMGTRIGMETVELDPHKKYLKPMGYGNAVGMHHQYIEQGRRPWKYRPAGSAIARYDSISKYPRTCAHRGFNTVAPESSMAALGAAVAMGAEEIEFDIWPTKDGELVVVHDKRLERLSNGQGLVMDHTYEELLELDFGSHFSPRFADLKILTFEEVLKRFACHVIMNIHVKWFDNTSPYDPVMLEKMIRLIRKYDCEKHVYLMSGNDTIIKQIRDYAPDICLCMGAGNAPEQIVDRAIAMNCSKVQLFKPHFNQEMIDKAHTHGIICNVFWSDDEEETREFLRMGIDTILTNDYYKISKVVKEFQT